MDDPAFPDSHYTTTTTGATTTTTTVQSPPLSVDKAYLMSPPGILRLVQIVLGLLYWILLVSCASYGGFPIAMSIMAWIFTLFFFVVFLLQLDKRVPAVHWVLTVLLHDLGWTVMHFICACIVANWAASPWIGYYYRHGCVSFSAVLGFALFVLYGVSTFFGFRVFQAGGGLSRLTGGSGGPGATATTTTTVTTTEYAAEKGDEGPPPYTNP
ncbi:CKLF-like MARVEL transmembrane domain-containing protein 8 [Patiria miniata]|uniref:MARVEL domain-containing protein n=1 Tax=Patiria miniata TaxID=46514 RepID=A0A914B394_PATMI|nr:CKLF-like MARVEL transmembrane domain-containing protein 8 [Patiria miniata]